MILFLRIAGLIATGVFAVLGMRSEHGNIKELFKHFPFWGVITTTVFSGALLFYETNKASKDAVEASFKIAKTAQQLDENLTATKTVADGMQKSLDTLRGLERENQNIASNLGKSLDTSQEILDKQGLGLTKQQALLNQQRITIANITGGTSFCYIELALGTNSAQIIVTPRGSSPLYDVGFRLWEPTNYSGIKPEEFAQAQKKDYYRDVGNVIQNEVVVLDTIPLPDSDTHEFAAEIRARNGRVSETIKLIRIQGQWFAAYRVTRQQGNRTITLVSNINPAFKGKVQW